MNNLSSYYGLVDVRIKASDKDLPVSRINIWIFVTTKSISQLSLTLYLPSEPKSWPFLSGITAGIGSSLFSATFLISSAFEDVEAMGLWLDFLTFFAGGCCWSRDVGAKDVDVAETRTIHVKLLLILLANLWFLFESI